MKKRILALLLFPTSALAFDNDYAARANPFERQMDVCFSERMLMGGSWYPDPTLESATKLTETRMCRNLVRAYVDWCKNNEGYPLYCEFTPIKLADFFMKTTPERMRTEC